MDARKVWVVRGRRDVRREGRLRVGRRLVSWRRVLSLLRWWMMMMMRVSSRMRVMILRMRPCGCGGREDGESTCVAGRSRVTRACCLLCVSGVSELVM